jgi:hypothetical protein
VRAPQRRECGRSDGLVANVYHYNVVLVSGTRRSRYLVKSYNSVYLASERLQHLSQLAIARSDEGYLGSQLFFTSQAE